MSPTYISSRKWGADDLSFGRGSYVYTDANGVVRTVPSINASYVPLTTSGTVDDAIGWIPVTGSLADAVNGAGASHITLYLPNGAYTITSDLTVASNVRLWFDNEAIVAIPNAVTLNINGPVSAGLYQIFSCTGTGKVVFGALVKDIYPEWFGNDLTITAASAPANSKIIFSGIGYTATTVNIDVANVTLFSLTGGTITQSVTGTAAPVIQIRANNVTVDGLTIVNQVVTGHEADESVGCIQITYKDTPDTRTGVTIKNCRLSGQAGIFTYNGTLAFDMADLTIENNYVRTTHYGIIVGPWGRDAVVNNNVRILNNDIQVTAGSYSGFQNARPLVAINTNNLIIRDNRSLGGFSGIEVYSGQSGVRPLASNVQVTNNIIDGHLGFTQVQGGSCSNNVVDMSLRDGSWPTFDNATVVAAWGYLSGIEAGSIYECSVIGNTIRNQVGPSMSQGGGELKRCTIANNEIYNSGATASPPLYAAGMYLDGKNEEVNIVNNVIETCAMSGIQQDLVLGYPYLKRCNISGNIIRGTQKHGILVSYMDGFTISNNNISSVNVLAGNYDGISFDTTYVAQNGVILGNTISEGRYSIHQPRTDAGYIRTLLFANNMSMGATTAPYLMYGKSKNNDISVGNIYTVAPNPTGHIPTTHGISQFCLDPGAGATITRIDGGTGGNIVTIYFARADTLMTHNATYMLLAGHVDVTPTAGSIMTFWCVVEIDPSNNTWNEVSRSIF